MLIIFDLDDTLVDSWNGTMQVKFKEVVAFLSSKGVEANFEKLWEINGHASNGNEALDKFFDFEGIKDKELIKEAIELYYTEPNTDFSIRLVDGAKELLENLKNHTLVVVTQGEEKWQIEKFSKSGLDNSLFSKIIVTPKYDKGDCYSELLKEFSVSASNSLVVGDKYKTDLLPAKKLGMKTAHIKWGRGKILVPKEGEVDYIIGNLKELQGIIENLE